jgi:hypothetical protein
MTSEEATTAVIDAIEALGIPYMLVGSLSCNYYAIPRSTQDADFVVHLEPGCISSLAKHLGPMFQFDPQMSFETVTATSRFVLRVADSPFVVEFFLLSDDSHDQQRFARRRHERILDRSVAIPTVGDVIVTKLRWSRAGRRTSTTCEMSLPCKAITSTGITSTPGATGTGRANCSTVFGGRWRRTDSCAVTCWRGYRTQPSLPSFAISPSFAAKSAKSPLSWGGTFCISTQPCRVREGTPLRRPA